MLNRILGDHPGVIRSATSNQNNLVNTAQIIIRQSHLVENQKAVVVNAPQQGVGHCLRLLRNFLQHEVVVTTLFGGFRIPRDFIFLDFSWRPIKVGHGNGVGAQFHYLVLAQFNGVAGIANKCRDVTAEEVLVVAASNDQRRIASSPHHHAWLVSVNGH
ncbi:unannotated protein [freshwater metagenome]|uniref:Unannotated protein n=1 Tax=freshwater metagenome TaxID=449393 RepID=A0A6J6VTB7_9ZZZZ